MKIAFIMDPLAKVKAYKDTTYYLMLASHQRGHRVFYLDHRSLLFRDHRLSGLCSEVQVHEDTAHPFSVGDMHQHGLDDMDVVMVRTDPPFDRTYFYTTLFLDLLPEKTKVVNRPSGLRNWNEKLAALFYPELTPATVITREAGEIRSFLEEQGHITLKPIDGHGGKGIVFLTADDHNLDQLIHLVTHGGRHQVIAQQYIPAAKEGDKRILLLDGEPIGGILRLHPEGKELNNLDAGGTAHPLVLNPRDLEICAALKTGLVSQGIRFCGIDILGDKLIEVNVTSPTGLQELCKFSGIPYHHRIIESLEQ